MILLQEELVSRALTEAGQVFIDPRILRFDDTRVQRDILFPCVKEYQAFRPPVVWEHLYIDPDGWPIPSRVRRVNGLRPLWLYYWPYAAAIALRPIPRMEAQKWFITNSMLYAPPGRYELEYISNEGYELGYEVTRHGAYQLYSGESQISFKLRSKPRPGTTKLYIGESFEATDDGQGALIAPWIDIGVIDYATCAINLTFVPGTLDPLFENSITNVLLEASYASVYPGVVGLDWSEVYFYFLFASKFLTAFATTRSIIRIDGLPVEMNVDGFLEYARQKEQEWLVAKEQRQSWWRW